VCARASTRAGEERTVALCGAMLLRVAEESGDESRRPEILAKLRHAVRASPEDSVARCQLGKALEWSQQWPQSRAQMEKCVQLEPDSPESHYRLARVYRRLGLTAQDEAKLVLQQKEA